MHREGGRGVRQLWGTMSQGRPLYLAKATGVIYAKSMWPRPTRRDTYTPTRPRYSPEYPSVVECRVSTKRRGGPVANMVSGSNLHLR